MATFFRNGSLSTFSGALDQFTIKLPFSSISNTSSALIKSADFNHYFDACIKIQQFLTTKLGKTFATLDNSTNKDTNGYTYGSALLDKSSHTFTFSSFPTFAVTEQTLSVPAAFGTTPFNDRTFTIIPTVVINDPSNLLAQGLSFYNMTDGDLLGHLETLPQFYPTIHPVNPTVNNQFVVRVNSFESTISSVKGLGQLLTGLVTENLDFTLTNNATTVKGVDPFLWQEPLTQSSSFTTNVITESTGTKYLRLYSNKSGTPTSNFLLSKVPASADCYVEATYKGKLQNNVLARAGMGLFNGTNGSNVSGWAIIFDEGTTGAAISTANIKVVEFQGVNLGVYNSGVTIPAWGSGTVTTLATITVPLNNSVKLSYNGTNLVATDTTTSTVLFTTSSLGISGNFIPGYFSKAEGNSVSLSSSSSSYIDIKAPLKVKSTTTIPTVKVNLLYVKSTDPAMVSTVSL